MAHWNHEINVGRPYEENVGSFSEHRDRVASMIRNSDWIRLTRYSMSLSELVDELAETESIEDFDEVFTAIYALADIDRCWIVVEPW